MPLSDNQRKQIHDLALDARKLLTGEARELLEGVYGLHTTGRLEPIERLPAVQSDPEKTETYRRLKRHLEDEVHAGLSREEAVEALVKEVAFTHLNRLVAFKMMEARKLIRGTLDRGRESNAFKFYLADPEHAADYQLYQRGQTDDAYRHFLLWQAGQVAQEIRVLFDPDNLVSRLFPRPRALDALLDLLNNPVLETAWQSEETIGWVYQYFNEPELQAAFAKVGGGEKFEAEDIPSATQLFTPHWIVRFLVQNTLGRLWVQMHPDTGLIDSELLDYLAPLQGDGPAEPLRPVKEITLLDPACGTMHFGLVAFDLLYAMYQEELQRAGEPGWPKTPSIQNEEDIPAAIIGHNLFGIDIDLRAVQLAALALYLKAKSVNKNAQITDSNLAVAGVLPLNGARLGAFLRDARFTRPVYERLLRALWERLQNARQMGSLLRLEKELEELIEVERKRYREAPLFAGVPGEFETEAAEQEFWDIIAVQIIRSLHDFARQQAEMGEDQSFFVGEAVKGLRLLDLMLREYDVVVTNPPYMNRRKMNLELRDLVEKAYPEGKNDLYAAFIQRCVECAGESGHVGMLTMHSYMFISSYEGLRDDLRQQVAILTMAHCGPGLFEVGNPGTLQTSAAAFRKESSEAKRENNVGTYFRLVHEPTGDGKRCAFQRALQDGSNTYEVAQCRFDAVPGSPWAYWLSADLRKLFTELPNLENVAEPKVGTQTGKNERFLRLWWEVGLSHISFDSTNWESARNSAKRWFPYMKGGKYRKWYGNQNHVVNWHNDAAELKANKPSAVIRNPEYYFREGLTWGDLNPKGFAVRYSPGGFAFDVKGSSGFPRRDDLFVVFGVMNSDWMQYALRILNPTASYQVGDIKRVPVPTLEGDGVEALEEDVFSCIRIRVWEATVHETTFDFIAPPQWPNGIENFVHAQERLAGLEKEANEDIYDIYGLSREDRLAIRAELAGEPLEEYEAEGEGDDEDEEIEAPMNEQELATRWISYAVGIALGRFQPGVPGALGSAIYRQEDFAVGSLPAPNEEEFDTLVGSAARFVRIDENGGRHFFSKEVEEALQALVLEDSIAVLDEGHAHDLPALTEQALRLMLGDEAAREVVEKATGDYSSKLSASLRKFLEKRFFTDWHFNWYKTRQRKAPIYWPLQSGGRSYGFILFHEKIDRNILYTLQRDYLDHKLNGLRLQLQDLQGELEGKSGAARKETEREMQRMQDVLQEVEEFGRTMARLAREGYEPEENWIDDGVILRMAPLWELIPIWKSEPRKYWKRLEKGDYDWAHIAMNYWPERVREACKTNKSFAIAHGHPSWYEGE